MATRSGGLSRRTSRRAFVQGGLFFGGSALLLAACGAPMQPAAPAEEKPATQAPTQKAAAAPKAAGRTPVLFWQWGVTYVEGFDTLTGIEPAVRSSTSSKAR